MDITQHTPEIDFDEFFARVERRGSRFADGQMWANRPVAEQSTSCVGFLGVRYPRHYARTKPRTPRSRSSAG